MFFTDNKSIFNFVHKKSIDIPKYLISDIVYFNKLPYDTYLHNDEDIDIINEYNMYKFKIIEKFFINDKWGSILLPVDNIKIVFESPDDIIYAYDKNLMPYAPSYKPKNRPKRLLESKEENYTSIVFKANNPDEFIITQKNLIDNGYDWDHPGLFDNIINSISIGDYPVYVFVEINEKSLSYMTYDSNEYYGGIDKYIEYCNSEGENINPHIFNYEESKYINRILYGVKLHPTYNSIKKQRTLESKILYPYRFKTEQEFVKEFGDDWIRHAFPGVGWNDDMNGLFGMDFPFNKYELNLNSINGYNCEDRRAIDDFYFNERNWFICWDMLTPNKIKPNYTPKKLIRNLDNISESYSTYPYNSIVVIFNNFEEMLEFKDYMPKVQRFESIPEQLLFNAKLEFNQVRDKIYFIFKINNNILDFVGWSGIDYLYTHVRSYGYKYEKLFTLNDVKNGLFKQIEEYGYFMSKPSYTPKNKPKRLLESKNNTLHVFDFDDTMFHSNNFEDSIKYLIEKLTPENILKKSINDININLKDLKYDNGRIYIDDIDQLINIPKNSDWIRKKDRIYLTQPESYYLTEEGMPIEINKIIVDLYNSVDNKAILTARKEKFKNIVLDTLHKFNIEEPNIGIFMYPDKTNIQPSMWKAHKLLEIYKNGNYNEIHYYDDNIKLLKKIKKHLSNLNINIYLYKVMKNKYRMINED